MKRARLPEASGRDLFEFKRWATDYVRRVNARWRQVRPDDHAEFTCLDSLYVGVLSRVCPDAPRTNARQAGRMLAAIYRDDPRKVMTAAKGWLAWVHEARNDYRVDGDWRGERSQRDAAESDADPAGKHGGGDGRPGLDPD